MAVISENIAIEFYLLSVLVEVSNNNQSFDIMLFDAKPMLNMSLSESCIKTLDKKDLPASIELKDGCIIETSSIIDIIIMNESSLSDKGEVDLSKGNMDIEDGLTLRDFIREGYHCLNVIEEDSFLRRYLLSVN